MKKLTRCATTLALALYMFGGAQAENLPVLDNPLLGSTASQIAETYGEETVYKITRNGKRIGTHTIRFDTDSNETLVSVDASIKVTVMKIPVYRLKYESEERWTEDTLRAVTATTTENGKGKTVALDRDTEVNTRFATNHWHPGVLTGNTVFNTLTGESSNITVTFIGLEQVETDAGMVAANHYQYDDDIEANVWYDVDGLWLKMKFINDDGSVIEYLRSS